MRRRYPFKTVAGDTPLAGYDPIQSPENLDEWRLSVLSYSVVGASPWAFGTMLEAWRGSPVTTPDESVVDWDGLLEELDYKGTTKELRAAGVEVLVVEDPSLHGYVATVVGTPVPGDMLREDAAEAYLKALALARHQAAVRLPRLGGEWGASEPATDAFRRRMVAQAVRDLGPNDLALAMHSLAAMPSEPGEEGMEPPKWGWSAERIVADARMLSAARSDDREAWRAEMDRLHTLAEPYSPGGWSPLALGIGAHARRSEAWARGVEIDVRAGGGGHEALLNGAALGVRCVDADECLLKALVVAQHESGVNLIGDPGQVEDGRLAAYRPWMF